MQCLTAVLTCGSLTEFFYVLQGVKQGAILSMLLYICFINELMKEINGCNIGCNVSGLCCPCVGFADDLAVMSLHAPCLQAIINYAWQYSCKWHFSFNVSKCAVMKFGKPADKHTFTMGNKILDVVSNYTHVGVVMSDNESLSQKEICRNIDKAKSALYSLVGCSLYKTALSPCSLTKLYWSVSVPKMTSCAEVRYFSDQEIKEYEKTHRQMAKDIQNLPANVSNTAAVSLLGWRDISSHIDFMKLMFLYRLLALNPTNLYRRVFLRRFYEIMALGYFSTLSPTAQIIKVCQKYNIIDKVSMYIQQGIVTSKIEWKRWISGIIDDSNHIKWRFDLRLSKKLSILRVIANTITPSVWWKLVQTMPKLKGPCITTVRLLCGTSSLRVHCDTHIPRETRLCTLCNAEEVEDTYHFLMTCDVFSGYRQEMLTSISQGVTTNTMNELCQLSDLMLFYIFMGLEYPICTDDLFTIRSICCITIHRMYSLRLKLET